MDDEECDDDELDEAELLLLLSVWDLPVNLSKREDMLREEKRRV